VNEDLFGAAAKPPGRTGEEGGALTKRVHMAGILKSNARMDSQKMNAVEQQTSDGRGAHFCGQEKFTRNETSRKVRPAFGQDNKKTRMHT